MIIMFLCGRAVQVLKSYTLELHALEITLEAQLYSIARPASEFENRLLHDNNDSDNNNNKNNNNNTNNDKIA